MKLLVHYGLKIIKVYYVSVKFHNSFRKFSGASHFNYNIWGLGVVNVKSVDALGGFDVINV